MRLIPRKITSAELQFTPGARITVPLSRVDRVVHHWMLFLLFDWAVTGGSGAGAFHSDPPARALREWIFNGNGDQLIKMGGGALYLYSLLFLEEVAEQILPSNLAAGAAQAGRNIAIYLPAAMGHALPGQEETFGVPAVASPSHEFLFGNAEDLVTKAGDADSYAFNNRDIRLTEWAYDEPRQPTRLVRRNGRVQQVPAGWSAFRAQTQEKDVNSSGQTLRFEFDKIMAGYELRAFIIEGVTDGQAGNVDFVYSDDVVTSITDLTINGRRKYETTPFREIQQENKRHYMLSSLQTGVAVIDAAADRNIGRGELWSHDTRESVPTLELTAEPGTGITRVRVTALFVAR